MQFSLTTLATSHGTPGTFTALTGVVGVVGAVVLGPVTGAALPAAPVGIADGRPVVGVVPTGLAGGDHLHFTMLVGGHPVNPVEWWDPKWMQDRVLRKLAEAGAPKN